MLRGFEKSRPQANVRAGVMPIGEAFGHAVLRRQSDNTDHLSFGSGALPEVFRKTPSATVLPAHAYSLQLVEAPNVPDDEVAEAVRWKIQHLIEFPIEEAVIETFEMPPPANPGAKPMIYAVVARRSEIQGHVDSIRDADIKIDAIDIPELCIRNIAVRLPQDQYGVAFLQINDGFGYLTITRGGVLYLIRRIELQQEVLAEQLQEIALQIQRSLDYYESQFDCPPVRELVLGPGDDTDTLSASLAQNLGLTVSQLDLTDLFQIDTELAPHEQRDCLMAIGAALRDYKDTSGAAA